MHDHVAETEDVVVTERGKSRWRISAVAEEDNALARLEHEGRYTPPVAEPTPWPDHPGGPEYTSGEAAELLDEMRGDN